MKIMKSEVTSVNSDGFASSRLGARISALHREGSASQRLLAEFILRNPIRVAAASIDEMARMSGVSAPTISRFARQLGVEGFADMRGAIAGAMQGLMDPVSKLREQLRPGSSARRGGETLDAIRQQIGRIDSGLVEAQAHAVAGRIRTARTVHVMGFGLSSHVAALMVLGLQPFHPSVSGVVEFGGTEVAAGKLMAIDASDVLIAITFPRYAQDVIGLTRYARDRGAHVVALTDSPASPLAPLASELVLAPSSHPVLSSSMAAAVAVAETIITTVMLSDKGNAEKAARLTQAIAAYLHQPNT